MFGGQLGSDEFVQAFARNGRSLWVLAAAWVGREDAPDLVQETARVAWERRAQFTSDPGHDGADVRAWLAQIARHLGANWRRRRQPESRAPADLPEIAAAAGPISPWPFEADRAGLADGLATALAALSESQRECLLLQVVMDHTAAEIAAMLQIPENTVASHVRRARLALRDALTLQEPAPVQARRTS
jgi:RNA polymerase sigma-70 factor (ECF subfamily)